MTERPWRVGRHYGIHVYEGDIPVATFHTVADAASAVQAHNEHAELRERLTRVEALCDKWTGKPTGSGDRYFGDRLRSALAAPATSNDSQLDLSSSASPLPEDQL